MAGLSPKRTVFVEEYLRCWNATEAARCAGYTHAHVQGPRLLSNVSIQTAVTQRLKEKTMTTDEVLTRLANQARSDIGVFFKIAERWTENPAPSEEVIDESIEFDDKGFQHTQYKVRAVVLDVDKLLDPHYSYLVKKFADTPRNGLTIELHDAQSALELIGRNQGMFKDKVELTGKDGGPVEYEFVDKSLFSKLLSDASDSDAAATPGSPDATGKGTPAL